MVRACCVPGCKSGKKLPSHQIPKDVDLRKKWLDNICRPDLKGNFTIHNKSNIKSTKIIIINQCN